MVHVHQNGIRDAFHESSNRFDVLIDGDGDHLEVVVGQLVLQYLPTWQVKDASSPAGESDE